MQDENSNEKVASTSKDEMEAMARAQQEEKPTVSPHPHEATLREMFVAGMHLGHKTAKVHPQMYRYIFGVRNGLALIDLEQTLEELSRAAEFIRQLAQQPNPMLLLVGTRVGIAELIREYATRMGCPCVNRRWLGGTLTNFPVISRRIKYFLDLRSKEASGELSRYTKKEQGMFAKEIAELERKLGGLEGMSRLPDAIIIVDTASQDTALHEAKRMRIPAVGIVDVNANPRDITYSIPANDEARPSVRFILERLAQAWEEGKQQGQQIANGKDAQGVES